MSMSMSNAFDHELINKQISKIRQERIKPELPKPYGVGSYIMGVDMGWENSPSLYALCVIKKYRVGEPEIIYSFSTRSLKKFNKKVIKIKRLFKNLTIITEQ